MSPTRPSSPLRDQFYRVEHRILPAGIEEPAALVEAVRLPAQDRREVEAEAVDVHLGDPVAQAVGHHLEHAGVAEVHGVAGPGVIDVAARLIPHQPVVRRVVDALERQRRPALVALRGVVVDHVQDDLEARVVQVRHHLLELGALPGREVPRLRREEADRVVAPVVGGPLVEQVAVVHERVNRQQLDCGDPEPLEMLENLGPREGRVRSADRLRHQGGGDGSAP
jgi:hypothetical protein